MNYQEITQAELEQALHNLKIAHRWMSVTIGLVIFAGVILILTYAYIYYLIYT